LIVLKFGGTSVGGPDPIRRLGTIVRSAVDRDPVVVVSAVAGVTNRLFKLAELALAGEEWETAFHEIEEIHRSILRDLGIETQLVDDLLDDLDDLVRGIASLRELTLRTNDRLVSYGERLSSRIVAAHLRSIGLVSTAWDAFDAGLITDGRHGGARPLPIADQQIREALANRNGIPVITGYIGRDEKGEITTLGRGGSDYSASIFGAALGAEEIQIWTDVDGVLTADPRIVPRARHIGRLSFAEASELAFYGAKVIHPATMVPAVRQNIPLRVLNSYRPEFPGTTIVAELGPQERQIKSITSKSNISVVTVVAPPMAQQYGFMERIADVFRRHEIVLDMIATSEVSVALSTSWGNDLGPVIAELSQFSEVSVRHGLAQVSVVGEELRDRAGLAAEVFQAIKEIGLNIEMISFGATRINLSFVVSKDNVRAAVETLHERLFEN
jgi:aspartate kinase